MESPFSHRFNTNYIPSDEEIQFIKGDLVSHAQELARIDERIRELAAQRDQIKAYIDSHKALISHPRRLPPDIVREIFVACLPSDRNAVMSAQEAPLLLCRICSAWRTIALSTPRLWASLHVPSSYVIAKEARTPAVIEWLQRSAACPISLSVTVGDTWHEPSSVSALLAALANFSARWRHVEFQRLPPESVEQLTEIRPLKLESFKFTGWISSLRAVGMLNVPSLRVVTLYSRGAEPIDDIVLTMPLVWDQLTHLTLQCNGEHRGVLIANVVAILDRCTRLISFQVSLRKNDSEIDSTSGPVLQPVLETLIMTEGSLAPQSLRHLVDHVSMPQLRRFHFAASTTRTDSLSLTALVAGSPLIEDLGNLYLPSLSAESIPETLRSLSHLTRLSVTDAHFWASPSTNLARLLHLLTPRRDLGAAVLCPVLQELLIRHCGDLQQFTLDAFIQGRKEFTPAFRRLQFHNPMDPDIVSEEQRRSYLSQGLDISIVHDESGLKPSTPWTDLAEGNQ
ncbi:hypothetical protein DFH08DRAFT_1077681 [Mycena albidolilacea]|uniref:F-box domain-containing protein n=1 Tax=Mycena albidolilacea TaxID=1033008 RepID=A0AAD7AAQ7_9AGAR|nr:hypothetical protein DFH08DRAFT_1077681 [Mycena albidolilacea]